MATRTESTRHPEGAKAGAPTWSDLERGLATTLPILGEAQLVIAARNGNRFVQFTSDPARGVRAETVSNSYLATPRNRRCGPEADAYTRRIMRVR